MHDPEPGSGRRFLLRTAPDGARLAIHIVYALYSAAVVFALPCMFGVLLAYLKLGDVRGSHLESHVRWQIRTFWIWLAMWVTGWAGVIVMVGWLLIAAAHLWLLYRIIKGWLALADGRPIERPEEFF